MALLVRVEETALDEMEPGNLGVVGANAVDNRRILLRLRDCLSRRKPFTRRRSSDLSNIVEDDAVILNCKPRRNPADLVVSLPLDSLFGFYDQVVHTHLFDESHNFLS